MRKWHFFLENKNIAQLSESDRFALHKDLEMFLPSFIFYLPQNLRLDWLHRWRDNNDKLLLPNIFIFFINNTASRAFAPCTIFCIS